MTIYYFASVNDDNFVDAVHLIDEEHCIDDDGQFNEEMACEYLNNFHGKSRWLRTCYDGSIRYHYAGVGYYYYEEYDAFIPPRPTEDHILDDSFNWRTINLVDYLDSIDV